MGQAAARGDGQDRQKLGLFFKTALYASMPPPPFTVIASEAKQPRTEPTSARGVRWSAPAAIGPSKRIYPQITQINADFSPLNLRKSAKSADKNLSFLS